MTNLEKLGVIIAFVIIWSFYYTSNFHNTQTKIIFSQYILKRHDKILDVIGVRINPGFCFFYFILDTFYLKVKINDTFTIIKKTKSVFNIKYLIWSLCVSNVL